MIAIAVLVGAASGFVLHGFRGAFVGALAGLVVGALFRRNPAPPGHTDATDLERSSDPSQQRSTLPAYLGFGNAARRSSSAPASGASPTPPVDATAIAASLARIEARLAAIESKLRVDAPASLDIQADSTFREAATNAGLSATDDGARDDRMAARSAASASAFRPVGEPAPDTARVRPDAHPPAVPGDAARQPDGTLAVATRAATLPTASAPPPARYGNETPAERSAPASGRRDQPPAAPAYSSPRAPGPMWAWLTGGNALTRIGVVILFFGVAFLLRYFTERFTIPLEWRLAAVAAFGVALAALGALLAPRRPGYGVSLIGAGGGVLYLTVFTAFRFYAVLPPAVAFGLLVVVAALVVWLAVRSDSQALAALALAGGFLAPILVNDRQGEPVLLFGYFAVLNAGILAIALGKAWRALNVLGFVFTFGLALVWGWDYYRPEHYATVQPFLALFFLFYVGIAILHAFRAPGEKRAAVDGILVFGVPLVGFALQTGIVRGFPYGVAWSAVVVGSVYGAIWLALRSRPEPGVRLLASTFLVLAILFGTLAIPYAADPHWTSAWWALEAAAVFWIGCRQQQRFARAFALLLQVGAALAFLWGAWHSESDRLFLNAVYFGTAVIGLAGFATAFVADRHADRLGAFERSLVPLLFTWGAAWWVGGALHEIERHVRASAQPNAALAFVLASVAAGLVLRRVLAWPRLGWLALVVAPAMLFSAIASYDAEGTTLLHGGVAVWPLAWVLLARALWLGDRLSTGADGNDPSSLSLLGKAHAAAAVALVAWLSWEASEWVGRWTQEGTAWISCAAALPAILFLAVVTISRDAGRWPLDRHAASYARAAGTVIAGALLAWFVMTNLLSPGDPDPLPYVPLANPLEIVLVLALWALFTWARVHAIPDERLRYGALGAALFLLVNAGVVRAVHHWLGIEWDAEALFASRPLQAAITLTWTATALPLMLWATRRRIRALWMVGAALLGLVVAKLFLADLAALAGLPRVVAFMGAGLLLLVIGYFAPLPPPPRSNAAGGDGARAAGPEGMPRRGD